MRWHFIIGIIISVACLAYLISQVDLEILWDQIKAVNYLYYLMMITMLGVYYIFRSFRWILLLRPVKVCQLNQLFSANLIGFMANNVLPMRMGELVRAYAASNLCNVPTSSILATLVVERIFDGMTLLAIMFLALLFIPPGANAGAFGVDYLRMVGLTMLIVYLAFLVVTLLLWRWPSAVIKFTHRLVTIVSTSLAQKVSIILDNFTNGLALFSQPKLLTAIILESFIIWGWALLMCYFFLPAVGLRPEIIMAAMALLGSSIAAAIPSAPGYVGTTQLAIMWSMMLVGAAEEKAAAYAIIYWAVCYFPVVLAGSVEMIRRGLKLSTLR